MKTKIDKRGFRKNWENLSKMKRFLILGMALFLIGGAVAMWTFSHTATTGLTISSSVPLTFTDNFNTTAVDTSSSSYSKTETIQITNTDGIINSTIGIVENITDVIDTCDNSNDINLTTKFNGVEVSDLDTLSIPNGINNVSVTIDAVKFSCPQDVEVEITLSPV